MSGCSRVCIPDNLRKTIEDIKEIVGKHNDEDIYTLLQDCNMDPNETAQKLLYLDTFHEVKRKRDWRKVSANTRTWEEHRQRPGMQRRGTRDDKHYSSYSSDDRQKLYARQENGFSKAMGRASKSSTPVLHKETKKVPTVASSAAPSHESTSVCNENSSQELHPQSAEHSIRGVIDDTKADYDVNSRKLLRPVSVKQLSDLDPGPTPTSTPTNPSTVPSRVRIPGGTLKSKPSHLANSVGSLSVSGLYSSASDPVLVPSLNPRNAGAVGIIKRETRNQCNGSETSANLMADSISNAVQNVNTGQAISGPVDLTSNQETCSVRPVNDPSKEMLPEDTGVASEDNPRSLPTSKDPCSEQATSEVDVKLHNLQTSARQSVIFPNHLHVPEAFKNTLTFGTMEPFLEQNEGNSNPTDISVSNNNEASKNSSLTPGSSSPISRHGDFTDQPESPPHVLVNLSSSQENISSGDDLRFDQSKQEIMQPVGRSHNSNVVPPTSEYGVSLVPPAVQLQGLEPQVGDSVLTTGTTPCSTQPRGIGQSSVAVSPQMFPLYRQPYPPNYVPYSPYFPQLYMPTHNVHQLGFTHQPLVGGNIYMPPNPASPGPKFPIPPVYKPGNMSHFGISSSYVSYGASGPGYGSVALPTSAGDEMKEKNIHCNIKQKEDLQASAYYNFPQGQPIAFPPAHNSFPGIYHPTQNMSSQSLHQSQPIPDSIVPPLGSYPQPQLLSLPQPQFGQMSWNQKLLN